MQNNSLAYRLNNMRVLGLPLQFLIVVFMGLSMTIFFGAWAADARIEARNQPYALGGSGAAQFEFRTHQATPLSGSLGDGVGGEVQGWERAFLFACPLH
ncbi:MAG: hypothetical protein IIB16_11925 [Chloroflexi bacterium]|nr:hypothetical protein [Chloroflexota bacterium]